MKVINYIFLIAGFCLAGGLFGMGQTEAGGEDDSSLTIDIGIMNEDREAVDSALIRIYNQDHGLLGEYYSSSALGYVNRIADPAVIDYYGWYFIEVSKAGYKTEEIKYELKNESMVVAAGIILKRDDGMGKGTVGVIVAGALVVIGGGWLYRRRRRKTR